jgi:hypothetical protein
MKYGILLIQLITLITANDMREDSSREIQALSEKTLYSALNNNQNDFTSENDVLRNTYFDQFFKYLESFKSENNLKSDEFKTMFLQNDACAYVHSSNDFSGTKFNLCETNTNANIEVRSISSIPSNKYLYMYEKEHCGGRAWKAAFQDPKFDTANNIAFNSRSYMLVDRQGPPNNCIWFYDKPCFQGNKREFCEDLFDMKMFGLDGLVGSFRINTDTKGVMFFDELYFKGRGGKTFYWSSYNIGEIFNQSVRSMRFQKD